MKRIMGQCSFFWIILVSCCSTIDVQAQSPVNPLSPSSSQGSHEIVWHEDLKSGWRESQRTGRPMVIFITSAHCRFCDAMKQATWHDVGIESRIGNEFVAVRLCPERNALELSRIVVEVYPTTLVALPQGKVIDHCKGFQPPALLHGLLNRVMK